MPLYELPKPPALILGEEWVLKGYRTMSTTADPTPCELCDHPTGSCKNNNEGDSHGSD